MTAKAFDVVFDGVPVPRSTCAHWRRQDEAVLNSAAEKIKARGANPWIFVGDGRHFWQFASGAEYAALGDLTEAEARALLDWAQEDWEQAFCGSNPWPRGE